MPDGANIERPRRIGLVSVLWPMAACPVVGAVPHTVSGFRLGALVRSALDPLTVGSARWSFRAACR